MPRQALIVAALLSTCVLAGCGGGGVASAPAPVTQVALAPAPLPSPTPPPPVDPTAVTTIPAPTPSPTTAPAPVAPPSSAGIFVTTQTVVSRMALPQSVATTPGTYDTIAYLTDQAFESGAPGAATAGFLTPSPIRITITREPPSFTVRAQLAGNDVQGTYVGVQPSRTSEFYGEFGYRIDFVYSFSDGTRSATQTRDITQFVAEYQVGGGPTPGQPPPAGPYQRSVFGTQLGLRYVALGEWGVGDYLVDATGNRQTRARTANFVYGERTAPADLPLSGTATYRDAANTLRLTTDFTARSIAAELDQPAIFVRGCNCGDAVGGFEGDVAALTVGVQATGSARIGADAGFSIPLAGISLTPVDEQRSNDVVAPVTGTFTGAFYGPQAVQAGGLAEILKANGDHLSGGSRTWAGVPFLLSRP